MLKLPVKITLPRVVEPLKGGQRLPRVAVLAVVIIFDDERPGRVRPFEQGEPPRIGHRGSKRKLVGRRDVDEAWSARLWGDGHPGVIDRYEPDASTRGREGAEGAGVAGILHQHPLAWIHEEAGERRQCLLYSGKDDDLLGVTVHTA